MALQMSQKSVRPGRHRVSNAWLLPQTTTTEPTDGRVMVNRFPARPHRAGGANLGRMTGETLRRETVLNSMEENICIGTNPIP